MFVLIGAVMLWMGGILQVGCGINPLDMDELREQKRRMAKMAAKAKGGAGGVAETGPSVAHGGEVWESVAEEEEPVSDEWALAVRRGIRRRNTLWTPPQDQRPRLARMGTFSRGSFSQSRTSSQSKRNRATTVGGVVAKGGEGAGDRVGGLHERLISESSTDVAV